MTRTSQASRRYAQALVETAAKKSDAHLDRIGAELSAFALATEQSFDLRNSLLNPVFTADERKKVLEAVITKTGMSEETARFLRLCVERDRMRDIADIAESYRALADDRRGRVRAEVQSAAPLSPEATERLRKALEKSTGKSIELDVRVDPDLIGGVRTRVGSMVFDGTIRTELMRLRERLTAEN